ncbi:MAG: hypothetical protein ACYSWU_15435 [Planctomycetota bacterium]|jgi:hypothetical protein
MLVVGRAEFDDFPSMKIAPEVSLLYFPKGNVKDRGYESVSVWLFQKPEVVKVVPGSAYGVPSFAFRADDETKRETIKLLKAVFGELYEVEPLWDTPGE